MYEKSLIILKPDTIKRRLVGHITQRFERTGFKIHAFRMEQTSPEQAKLHYAEHISKDFYKNLERYITSGPVVVMVLGGINAIQKIRRMIGETDPSQAQPGTIRGDLAHQGMHNSKPLQNLIHASANGADAEREIGIWFQASELVEYALSDDSLHGI